MGWKCINADVIQYAVDIIAKHMAEIKFCWVKGHSDNMGNDTADALAKEGAGKMLPFSLPAITSALSFSASMSAVRVDIPTPKVMTLLPPVAVPKVEMEMVPEMPPSFLSCNSHGGRDSSHQQHWIFLKSLYRQQENQRDLSGVQ